MNNFPARFSNIYIYLFYDAVIIILNSTCTNHRHSIKHLTYKANQAEGAPNGVAILIKHTTEHALIHRNWFSTHFLAIKTYTDLGPLVISTTYTRLHTNLPFGDLNYMFNYNKPVIHIADMNATLYTFQHHNTNRHGTLLHVLMIQK